ncbi:rab-GTPase-TBC domain-containing protein [Xylaria sp. CBS 124048]|nr:rab-GTPase-TBC domain-containing protein [Xylaria sp. CBS 124048]
MAAVEKNQHSGDTTDTEPDISISQPEAARIVDACERGDIDELRDIALAPGGFLSDHLRSRAWPVLLGIGADATPGNYTKTPDSWRHLPRHRDEEQVGLDVNRSFVYYPNDNSQAELDEKKAELLDLITEVLRKQPYLCYFQGYHDICQVLLLALPASLRTLTVSRLSVLRIRDFMLPTLAPAILHLRLIPDLLHAVDPKLCQHLSQNEPYFALSDTLTMFAHNVQQYRDIARLFDVLIAREQVFSIYIFTQIMLQRRDELLAHDEPDMLHFVLSKLPPGLDLEAVINKAALLIERHPPESLRSWRQISGASVLKTTRDVKALASQSLRDGHILFERQVRELRWAESCQKMMRAAWANRTLLFAVVVGISAVYLRRTPAWASLIAWATRWPNY